MRIALALVVVASTLGQSTARPFAGRWTAEHGGRGVVRLDLRMDAGGLVGSMQLADIHVDAQGEVDTVLSDLSSAAPLIEVAVRGNTLAFARRDGDDVEQFEMSVVDDRTAELRFMPSEELRRELANDGIPLPKPIRLRRAAP